MRIAVKRQVENFYIPQLVEDKIGEYKRNTRDLKFEIEADHMGTFVLKSDAVLQTKELDLCLSKFAFKLLFVFYGILIAELGYQNPMIDNNSSYDQSKFPNPLSHYCLFEHVRTFSEHVYLVL